MTANAKPEHVPPNAVSKIKSKGKISEEATIVNELLWLNATQAFKPKWFRGWRFIGVIGPPKLSCIPFDCEDPRLCEQLNRAGISGVRGVDAADPGAGGAWGGGHI